ncbi:MAG TPA: hypothetical protein VGB94_12095 [Acidobacteriaceae bacterium]
MMLNSNFSKALCFITTLLPITLLTGCGVGGGTASQSSSATPVSAATRGYVNGGNLPVTGADVNLYVAGVNTPGTGTGYGSGATLLIHTKTDQTGSFIFNSGDYTCPTPTQQAYIVVSGGNPGLGGTVNNPYITLMAALGPCPAGGNLLIGDLTHGIAPIPFINVDEITTVAAVWALQQFMTPPGSSNTNAPNIGAPNTTYTNGLSAPNTLSVQPAVVGMNNAFTTAKMLADIATGTSPNLNYPYATPESAKINTLADIIATCVNTDPTASSICSNMMADATPSGATTAADTIQALWYIAQHPIHNVSNLYGYVTGTPPFSPTYTAPGTLSGSVPSTTAFNDTTIAINYAPVSNNLPVLGKAFGLAIDAYGNAWFTNQGQTAVSGDSPTGAVAASIAELGPDGNVLLAPVTTFNLSTTGGSASKFTVAQPTNTRTIIIPTVLAIDLTNQPWFVNGDTAYTGGFTACSTTDVCAGDLGVFSASSAASVAGGSSSTGYLVGYGPSGMAIDGNNNVFVTNPGNSSGGVSSRQITHMSALDGSGFTSSAGAAPNTLPGGSAMVAVDTNPNVPGGIVWVENFTACPQPLGGTTVDFGILSLYGGTAAAALSKSEVATTYDPNATTGAGTSGTTGNCNQTNINIGQLLQSPMANPNAISFDRNNGAWLTNQIHASGGFDGLTYITAPADALGTISSSTTLVNGVASSSNQGVATSGTTMSVPYFSEVDGNNNVWVSVNSIRSIVEASVDTSGGTPVITLQTPGQGSAITGAAYGLGFVHNTLNSRMLAIDPSGNIWVTNEATTSYVNQSGSNTSMTNSVTVLVGAAGPVVTPISLRMHNKLLGTKP